MSLNGRRAVVIKWAPSVGRYELEIFTQHGEGQKGKVRPENMKAISDLANISPCAYPACTTGNPGTKVCSRCKSAAYCCVACQRGHWAVHKTACKVTVANLKHAEDAVRLAVSDADKKAAEERLEALKRGIRSQATAARAAEQIEQGEKVSWKKLTRSIRKQLQIAHGYSEKIRSHVALPPFVPTGMSEELLDEYPLVDLTLLTGQLHRQLAEPLTMYGGTLAELSGVYETVANTLYQAEKIEQARKHWKTAREIGIQSWRSMNKLVALRKTIGRSIPLEAVRGIIQHLHHTVLSPAYTSAHRQGLDCAKNVIATLGLLSTGELVDGINFMALVPIDQRVELESRVISILQDALRLRG